MNIALILAGGSGVRLGADVPKQYIEVKGKTVITYCLEVFGAHPSVDAIQIVAHEEWRESISKQMTKTILDKFMGFSATGSIPSFMVFGTSYSMPKRQMLSLSMMRPGRWYPHLY